MNNKVQKAGNKNNLVEITDQSGVELAVARLVASNESLLPNNAMIERIKNSAGFYIVNSKNKLMELTPQNKMKMLYGVLKEAMVGCEAGTDFDIVPFKGEPTIIRNKNGWFKIIDLIKPAEIIRFTTNVIIKGDEYTFDPVTEELEHSMIPERSQKYEDVVGTYAYIRFKNGFEKTVFMSKSDLDLIKDISPSGKSEYSPWNSNSLKMVQTKVTKELAKGLFTLFSGRVNSIIANAIENDENVVTNINEKGYITISDKTYGKKEIINQDEPIEEVEAEFEEVENTVVNINEL